MSGTSMGHSHHRPCSAEKTLRRCRNTEKADNVILIDADSESFDNVVIIDLPESFPKRKIGSGRLRKDKWSWGNVIYIDDDETPNSNHSVDVNNASFSAATSSNREPCPATTNFADSTDPTVEGCQYVPDNTTPVRLSKCKRTYSGKSSRSNRYGLNTDSEGGSSDSDYPDCELVEDSSGKVQKLWEKAFSRRRKDFHSGQSGIRDHGSTSQNPGKDQHQNFGVEDVTGKQKEASFFLSKEKSNNKTEGPYTSRKEDIGFGCSSVFDDPIDVDLSQSASKTDSHNDVHGRYSSEAKGSPSVFAEEVDRPQCVPGGLGTPIEEKEECLASSNSSFWADHQAHVSKDSEMWSPIIGSCVGEDPCSGKSSRRDGHHNYWERDADSVEENDEHLATGSVDEMDKFMPEICSFKSFTVSDSKTHPIPSPSCNVVSSVSGKSLLSKNFLVSGDEIEQGQHQENKQPVLEIPLSVNIHLNQTRLQEDDSLSNSNQANEDGQMHIQNADTIPSVEISIINEREKIKETDEYKRAIEEEWASRQQALAAQAEEAQQLRRLLKRRKAESLRLLDMERRQKQRLEEIRNTQKQDEENMNLKELIRAEVRNELKKLEMTCQNMASLLHSLGIHVSGWPNPLPQQVQTAYKKALLTFHPDRASQSDIRGQVEAEEKFKLINRMKEKFSPSFL